MRRQHDAGDMRDVEVVLSKEGDKTGGSFVQADLGTIDFPSWGRPPFLTPRRLVLSLSE